MSEEFEMTYFEVWGEMPVITDDQVTDADQDEPAPGPAPGSGPPETADGREPALGPAPRSEAPPKAVDPPPQAAAPAPDPQLALQAEKDRKANEVIQRMMVDTLRRVEARLALMDEHQAHVRATVPGTVQDLCEQLTKLAEEIGRSLQRTRQINEELAGIQIESARNLALIAKKVKELESRPLHQPPR